MPKITRERSHSKSLDEAKQTVEKLVNEIKADYPNLVSDIKWNADHTAADVKGKMFKGKFEVNAAQVKILIDLSMLARPFMGKIESTLDSKLEQYF